MSRVTDCRNFFDSENQLCCQKLAQLLFEAASDSSYVDPRKVEQILGTTGEDVTSSSPSKTSVNSDWTGL